MPLSPEIRNERLRRKDHDAAAFATYELLLAELKSATNATKNFCTFSRRILKTVEVLSDRLA
jgi:hypothetical protein